MRIERYESGKKHAWDAFVAAAKNGHFMHQRDYMDYHADRFIDHSLMVYEEQELVALLPANAKDSTLYSHQGLSFGGFITSADMRMGKLLAAIDAVKTYAASQGLSKLVYKAIPYFYHQSPAQEDLYALSRAGASLVRTDVSTTIDYAAPIAFSTLRKRGAKKAEKAGVTVSRTQDIAAFHAILRRILEEKYDVSVTHSQPEMELLFSRFPAQIQLHAAYLDEEMLAGVLIFETATVAHAQYIGASEKGRDLGALDLLFTALIDHYKTKRYFDFGISTEQAGTVLNEKLIAQKEGFGGRASVHQFYELALA